MKYKTASRKEEIRKEIDEKLKISNIAEDISVVLQSYMLDQGWSARSLGEVTRLGDSTIRRVLKYNSNVTIENLHKICLALGITLSEFLENVGYQEPEK